MCIRDRNQALDWASQHVNISTEERNVIIKSKYAFLYHGDRAWVKKSGVFDNGMGFLDGAESTDLIGLFLLSKTQHLGMKMGKFRDDGLAISWLTPRETENAAKKLSQIKGADANMYTFSFLYSNEKAPFIWSIWFKTGNQS